MINIIFAGYLMCNLIITIYMYEEVMNTAYSDSKKLLGLLTLMCFGSLLLIYALCERFIEEWQNYDK